MLTHSERMFETAVKEYLRLFPEVEYKLDIPAGDFWVSAGDSEVNHEIYDRVQQLAEYYGCDDLFE